MSDIQPHRRRARVRAVATIALARLRFAAVFVVAALVVGYWDNIKNHFDRWTRPAVAPDSLAAASASTTEFYCPMHPDVVRDAPGQCPKCGMPLVKRKRGEAQQLPPDVLARVSLTPRRVALAGIGTTPVEPRELLREVRSVGVLDFDETRVAQISARVGGRADELFVRYTGQAVKRGDPVYSLYSPDVFTALRQYLQARKRVNDLPNDAAAEAKMDASTDYNATMQKLVLWGVTREQLDAFDEEFDRTGKIPNNLTVAAPLGGIVVRKSITPGQYVQVGETPYTVADLSRLWLQLKLYERDVPLVQIGDPVAVVVEAFPNDTFQGTVTFKSFQLDPETRTLDARVEVDNPGLRLRPGMFADAVVRVAVTPATATSQPATSAPTPSTVPAAAAAPPPLAFREALTPYLEAARRLAGDNADDVAGLLAHSASKLQAAGFEALGPDVRRYADAVAATKGQSLADLRKSFKDVSGAMIDVGKAVGIPADGPVVRVFRCPMKKANWLQEGDATANPYYGAEMFSCGSAVESLPRANPLIPATRPAVTAAATAAARSRPLAVPRWAVIDTGRDRIVYVESSPGVFDMRAVKLGPLAVAAGKGGRPAEEYYPVVDGLDGGDRVVTAGAFLVDAENRLNPSRAAAPAGPELLRPATPPAGHQHGN